MTNNRQDTTDIQPGGGTLIDLMVDAGQGAALKECSLNLPSIMLNSRQLCDFELLVTGAFTPLAGYLCRSDYESVIERMRLSTGQLWPVPICLDVPASIATGLGQVQEVAIRDPEGFLLAILQIEELWQPDREKEALSVYGTCDRAHPGVNYLLTKSGDWYVGGKLQALSLPIHVDFKQHRLTPREIRRLYKKLGWRRVVGFQTRNPIHRSHYELTIRAMQQATANLLLLPMVDMADTGSFDHYTRLRCYKAVSKHYPPDSLLINLLPLSKRMAGPRNAVLHTLIAKNYGCTHFIIGRNHACPGNGNGDSPLYETYAAQELIRQHAGELGIDVLPFEELVYCPSEDEFRPQSEAPAVESALSLSGSQIWKKIRAGKTVPAWATFPEVEAELRTAYPTPDRQGISIFMTGLSGAGKSTIAKILYSRFLEIGTRPVTLLDGDIVRHNLSSELNFSREHRDINVRRIGFVAGEITKNRGIAICAPIAPYAATRMEIRQEIEAYGGFVEVHVATPVEECEKRDRKGMYAKARAGLIKDFTGVDDPYEAPESPEVRIDTTDLTPYEAAQEILLFLGQRGYI